MRPTVAMQSLLARADPLDGHDASAGADQRVAAPGVRRTAGVPGLADDDQPEPTRARDRGDVAQRGVRGLEVGALLDVRLEVADHARGVAGRVADGTRVEAEVEEGLVQRRAVAVAQVPVGLVPQPRDRLAPQQRGAEPGALLVAERRPPRARTAARRPGRPAARAPRPP